MKIAYINSVTVNASLGPDAPPQNSTWDRSHPLEYLERVLVMLKAANDDMKAEQSNPLKAALPIVTDSVDFTLQTPK